VRANRALALDALGAEPSAWTSGKQVHETAVVHADEDRRGAGAFDAATTIAGTDGLWTSTPGVALAVLTADCVPVVVADPNGRRVAALHAGWRGLTAGILERGVEALREQGSAPAELMAFVGPAIGPCCYEVGDDVAAAARDALGEDAVVKGPEKAHVDLWTGARIALARAGVTRVWLAGLCTRSEPHRFYSHRAGATGRQGAIVMLA
jgi:YfiH family protein